MATALLCDGCGMLSAEVEKVGLFKQFEYCDDCVQVVTEFLLERDKLQEDVALVWKDGLEQLVAEVLGAHPDMKLPDV